MKNIKLSILTIISIISLANAGGDISPITPYEVTDVEEANVEAVEIIPQKEEPEVVMPQRQEPTVEESATVAPPPKEPVVNSNNTRTGFYVGMGGTVARYDTNCNCTQSSKSGTDKSGGVIAKVGYNVNKYIGIEARGVSTMIKEDGAKVTHYGVYVKPMIPITKKAKAYALVGLGKSKTSGELRESDVDGLAWGGGIDYEITDNVSAFIDYTKLIQKGDSNAPKLDSVNIGANYNF